MHRLRDNVDGGDRRVRTLARGRERLVPLGAEARHTEPVDDELHAPVRRVFEVAVGDEHVHEGLRRRDDVVAGDEVTQFHCERGRLAEASAAPQLVAGLAVAHDRHERGVVHARVLAALGRSAEADVHAAREPAVELSGAGEEGVADEARVGETVERFVETDAGVLAADDVPHRVAARRAGGQADALQLGENRLDISVVHPVQLETLARREMQPIRRVATRDAGDAARLLRREHTAGYADAHHEDVVLRLCADAVRLQGVPVLERQPSVAVSGQPSEIDVKAGTLRSGNVDGSHRCASSRRGVACGSPRRCRSVAFRAQRRRRRVRARSHLVQRRITSTSRRSRGGRRRRSRDDSRRAA